MSTRTRIVIGSVILIVVIGIFISAIVPLKESVKKTDKITKESTSVFPIDVNTADEKALQMLPNIGPSKAKAIVDYRQKSGPFKVLDDLLKVPGIGQLTLDKISKFITGISSASYERENAKININKATSKEIENLPSIGPTKAREIVSYRENHGPFCNFEDLRKVSGIGSQTIKKIKDLIEF